uniref:Uncharacterized protein n=1 Tax=Dicentrarchus labrax TaxID=13489 RepID=A0A8C4ITX2_DICLA
MVTLVSPLALFLLVICTHICIKTFRYAHFPQPNNSSQTPKRYSLLYRLLEHYIYTVGFAIVLLTLISLLIEMNNYKSHQRDVDLKLTAFISTVFYSLFL